MKSIGKEKKKFIETRSWKTNYRGEILIHAGKCTDKKELERLKSLNLNTENGAIIGKVTITDCILVDKDFQKKLKKECFVMEVWALDHL